MHKMAFKILATRDVPLSRYKFAFPTFIQTIPGGPSTTCHIDSVHAGGRITASHTLSIKCYLK